MSTYHLKVTIDESDPAVWRKLVVPDHTTFHQLHLMIQQAFQWKDYHLYKFEMPDIEETIEPLYDDDPYYNEHILSDSRETLIDSFMSTGLRFSYVYDFGDYWEHTIDVEGIDPADESRVPRISAYQGESMIDDAGGPGGYYEKMRILENPKDPQYRCILEWVDWQAPRKFVMESINGVMAETLYIPKAAYTAARKRMATAYKGLRVSLEKVVDGLFYQTDNLAMYIDLGTGEVRGLFLEDLDLGDGGAYSAERRAEYEACESLMLPRPEEIDDYKMMCDFAASQEGAVGEKLNKAVQGRGAFKRFKSLIDRLGLYTEWKDFRREAYSEIARNFLEENGIRWK